MMQKLSLILAGFILNFSFPTYAQVELCKLDDFCYNGGVCQSKEAPLYFECSCKAGFVGLRCEKDIQLSENSELIKKAYNDGYSLAESLASAPSGTCPPCTTPSSQTSPSTGKNADIIFLIETSELIGENNFAIIKEVVMKLSHKFTISPSGTRVSLVHFSSPDERTGVLANLDDTVSYDQFKTQIEGLRFVDVVGVSDIAMGLEVVRDKVLPQKKPENEQFIILIARGSFDHSETCCPDPRPMAHEIRKTTAIFAVEMPVASDPRLLAQICGSYDCVYDLDNYRNIYDNIEWMLAGANTTTGVPPTFTTSTLVPTGSYPTVTVSQDCQKLDILFIADSSQSIGEDNFRSIKQFMIQVVKQFSNIGQSGAQFSEINFNRQAHIKFYFYSFESTEHLMEAINGIYWLDGISNSAAAFEKAASAFTQTNGGRSDVTRVAIFFSDGIYTEGFPDPVSSAKDLRLEHKVRIISVGTVSSNTRELAGISGSEEMVVLAPDWNQLSTAFVDLMQLLPCGSGSTTVTPSYSTSTAGPKCYDATFDVVVLIDTSTDATRQGFEQEKYFIKQYFTQFNVSLEVVRVGLVAVGASPIPEASLVTFRSNPELYLFLDSLSYTPTDGLDLADALGYQGATEKNGYFGSTDDRPNAQNVVIVLANRSPNFALGAKMAASSLRSNYNAEIITVLGPDAQATQFAGIASNRDFLFQFSQWSNDAIDKIVPLVKDAMCK